MGVHKRLFPALAFFIVGSAFVSGSFARGNLWPRYPEFLPMSHSNTYIKYEGERYEIYWTSNAAKHVLDNYVTDLVNGPHHGLDHCEISQLLRRARYVIPGPVFQDARPYIHAFLTGRKSQVFETYVYLVPELDGTPRRCVVVSSYKSNKSQYRSLFAI